MAKKNDKPYLLMKAVGALVKHRNLSEKEAFEAIEEDLPDLIVLDIIMDEMKRNSMNP